MMIAESRHNENQKCKKRSAVGYLRSLLLAGLVVSIGGAAIAQIPCSYQVGAIIQAPPCPFTGSPPTIGTGMSPNGRYVCGYWYQCDTGYKAFYYDTTTGQFISLPFPSGVISSQASAVNDSGVIAGTWVRQIGLQMRSRGFVYTIATGQYVELLPTNLGGDCVVNSINASGQVCGRRSIGTPNDPVYPWEAFIWFNGVFTGLGFMNGPTSEGLSISDLGVCVGGTGSIAHAISDDARGFIHSGGRLTILPAVPNGFSSVIRSQNTGGQFLAHGKIQETPLLYRAFVYTRGTWDELQPPPGFDRSDGYAMSENGTSTGSVVASSSPQTFHAAIWSGRSVALVQNLVVGGGPETAQGGIAIATNGTVLVTGKFPGGNPRCRVLIPHYRIPGDTDCNEQVNVDDLLSVINSWGPCSGCAGDLTGNGFVNVDDLLDVVLHWS